MGLPQDVIRIEKLLDLHPSVTIDHLLMTITNQDFSAGNPPRQKIEIRRASISDTDKILHLREAYELEEVQLNCSNFSRNDCRIRLRTLLQNEIVYIVELQGIPIAKAATSVRGIQVDQIGGVFTAADHRRQGMGMAVIESLLKEIFCTKKQACLFVKKGNKGAINLYKQLGFRVRSSYRISYYI